MSGSPPAMKYEAAGSDVIWEAFEDEVVAINLDNGCYYALDPLGGFIFESLVSGVPVDSVVERITAAYEGEGDVVDSEVEQFVDRLLDAGLVRPHTGNGPVFDAPTKVPATKTRFQSPQIRVFTDMQDLLLIDPIHEVDAMGWPIRQDAGGE